MAIQVQPSACCSDNGKFPKLPLAPTHFGTATQLFIAWLSFLLNLVCLEIGSSGCEVTFVPYAASTVE